MKFTLIGLSVALTMVGSPELFASRNFAFLDFKKGDWDLIDIKSTVEGLSNNSIQTIYFVDPESFLDSEDLSILKKKYPYNEFHEETKLLILSSDELEHLNILEFGPDNFVCEYASSASPELFYLGHLPNYKTHQINLLRSYLEANHPYCRLQFQGDLDPSSKIELCPWKLCVKNSIEVNAEADNKGNKKASCEYQLRSDDNKNKAYTQIEYKENEKGEKEVRGKISYKKEF